MQSQTIRRITSAHAAFSVHRPATRHLPAHLSRLSLRLFYPYRALFLSLMLLAGLDGCGPASSDNAPNLGPRASVNGKPQAEQSSSPRQDLFTPAARPAPLAQVNQTDAISGGKTGEPSPSTAPVPSSKPADPMDTLVVPAWMAKDLESPDIGTRLRALETWVQSAPPGSIDPLILAYENKDERVRARAMELIEQGWARMVDAEK